MKLMSAAAIAAVLLAACASSETTTQAAPAQAAKVASASAAKDPNAMVCKNKKEMGSNMPTRTCLTQAQWDAQNTRAKEASDEINRTLKNANNACGADPRC